jgi:hypothetical protein
VISAGRIAQPIMRNLIDFKAKTISRYTRIYDADLAPLVADRGILFRVITMDESNGNGYGISNCAFDRLDARFRNRL